VWHGDVVEFGGVTDDSFCLLDATVGVQPDDGLWQQPTLGSGRRSSI